MLTERHNNPAWHRVYTFQQFLTMWERAMNDPANQMPAEPTKPAALREATGTIGVPIPAEAGDLAHEISQPLTAEAVAQQLAKAQANERQLAPLNFDQMPTAAASSTEVVEGGTRLVEQRPQGRPMPLQTLGRSRVPSGRPPTDVSARVSMTAEEMDAEEPAALDPPPDPAQFPAASNTDSPKRGIPGTASSPFRGKPSLQPEGGFGVGSDGEYYPLAGDEVLELARALLDDLAAKIANDLRFSMAVCYPKLRVTLTLQIANEIEAANFAVISARREFDDQDNPETPADALREELGITGPHKQVVQSGAGMMLVDVTR